MDQNLAPTAVLSTRVKELRKSRGWSADQLAQEMKAVGSDWTRMVVTKLENGRRQDVSVAEWLALAYVLDVPPLELLAPLGHGAEVEILPGLRVGAYELRGWLTGTSRLSSRITPDTAEGMRFWQVTSEPVKLYDQATDAIRTAHHADIEVRTAEKIGDSQRAQTARSAYVGALRNWAEALTAMQEMGMKLPAYAPRWRTAAVELGFLEEPDAV